MSSNEPDTKRIKTSRLSFAEKLQARIAATKSLLCVGLDPHVNELQLSDNASPTEHAQAAYTFCTNLITATLPYAVCYKPNAAFFECIGSTSTSNNDNNTDDSDVGMDCLRRVIAFIHAATLPNSPQDLANVPVLLDVKRGDIGSTAQAYAMACYDLYQADAVTLSPLMGFDSIQPFLQDSYTTKGAFLLCKTSNPGSNDLLTLELQNTGHQQGSECLYQRIARLVGSDWKNKLVEQSSSSPQSPLLGLVVGATDATAMKNVRTVLHELEQSSKDDCVWILAPGVGAQGGSLEDTCRLGINPRTGTGLLLPVSRGISRADNPAEMAKTLSDRIKTIRQEIMEKYQAEEASKGSSSKEPSIAQYQTNFLKFALQEGVLKFGSFVLKSGRTSPYFFNAGLFCTGQSLFQLGQAYAATIMNSTALVQNGKPLFDVVFGPAYKGISLGAVVSSALFSDYGVTVGFAYNRKEAKDHGEGGVLVGASMKGKKVLIVDDVITAGTAIRESHTMLTSESVSAEPVGVVIALDRAEVRSLDDRVSAVQAVARDLKLQVVSIVNLPQLQTFLENSSEYGEETLKSVVAYRKEFGV